MAYLRALAGSVFSVDRSQIRGWSAARRTSVVLAALLVGTALAGPLVGGLGAIAAVYIGLQDRAAEPPRYTTTVMAAEAVLLSLVLVVAGIAPGPAIPAVVLVSCAVISGLTAHHDKAVSRMFADVLQVVAFVGLVDVDERYALQAALAVLVAGLTQALLTLLAAGLSSDLPERRPVALAIDAVAAHLDDALTRQVRGTGEAAEAALQRAEVIVGRSDLSHQRRRALRRLIADAEVLREEAAALRARQAFAVRAPQDPELDQQIALAVMTLELVAAALRETPLTSSSRSRRQQAGLEDLWAQNRAIAADEALRPAVRALAQHTARLAGHTDEVLSGQAKRDSKEATPVTQMWRPDRGELTDRDWRAGMRLGLAAVIGLVLAAVLAIPSGEWVAATTVALLRPEQRALTSDTVARAAGTALGALAVIPLVALTADVRWATVVVIVLLALAAFMVTSANEGLFIVSMTLVVVFTRAAAGEDPVTTAIVRTEDVIIGCLIAVTLLYLVPVRRARRLARDLAHYADSTAALLAEVERLCRGKRVRHPKRLARQVRTARTVAQGDLDVRKVEPLGKGLPVSTAQRVFAGVHDCERLSTAALMGLRHGDEPGDEGSTLAKRAAAALSELADLLAARESSAAAVEARSSEPVRRPTTITDLLHQAAQEAESIRDWTRGHVNASDDQRRGIRSTSSRHSR